MNHGNGIIASEGRRPFWQTLIAGFCYTIAIALVIFAIYVAINAETVKRGKGCISTFEGAFIFFLTGLRFSLVRTLYFDPVERKYKKESSVGPFHIGKWESLPEVEYVSVFRQVLKNGSEIYTVNIWYAVSKHIVVYDNIELEPAYQMGLYIAKKMEVDFLDASNPHDKKWVEITEIDDQKVLQDEEEHHVH